jgi:hypothetical protein
MLHLQSQALAYIDAGSGSFFIQMLLAGVLGASFMARTFWASLISKFKKNSSADVN